MRSAFILAVISTHTVRIPNGIGMTIAAASGVGSVGTGPLVFYPFPFVYPLVSIALVNFAWY